LIVRDLIGVLVVLVEVGVVAIVEFVLTDVEEEVGRKMGSKRSFVAILEVLEVIVDLVIVEFVVFEVILSIYF
jgi:hypothetical protein